MRHTKIDPEEKCKDIGCFSRNAVAFHKNTGKLVRCKATIPDTWFSVPATTKDECGYLTGRDDGELEFRPYTNQTPPAEFRKQYKKDCR
jgi:hypothetical protein